MSSRRAKSNKKLAPKAKESSDDSSSDSSDESLKLTKEQAQAVLKYINDLLTLLETTNEIYSTKRVQMAGLGNVEEKTLRKYRKFVTNFPNGQLHAVDFIKLLERYPKIPKGDDRWLIDGEVVVKSQEDAPDSKSKVKIMLSVIYNRAVDIHEAAAKVRNSGLPSAAYKGSESFVLPDRILVTLYKIFMILAPTDEKKYTTHMLK